MSNPEFTRQLAAGCQHLTKQDARLAPIISRTGPCLLAPHTDYYGSLVDAIISQQLSVKAGDTILARFKDLYDGKLPTPEQILATDIETMRNLGASYAKANYIQDLARHIIDGRLDLTHIASLPNDDIIKQLIAVKGIGEWSTHMFMIFSLGRLDILPVGDLGIRKAVQNVYKLKALPSPAEINAIAKANHWQPYATIASWYLWRSLEQPVSTS